MLKFAIFAFIFLVVIPLGGLLTRRNEHVRNVFFICMLFFTCTMQLYHIAPDPEWTGSARGYALSAVDIFSSILLLGMLLDDRCKITFLPPGWWTYGLYALFILLSGVNAEFIHAWGGEVTKMWWMYVFFIAAYNYLKHHKDLWIVVYAIIGILLFMLLVGLYQKYLSGRYFQIPSTMPHQNSLSLYIALFGSLLLGVMMNEKSSFGQQVWLFCGIVAAALLSIFTYSRGGMICFAAGLSIVAVLSIFCHGLNSRRSTIMGIGLVGGLIVLAIAMPTIIKRFKGAPEASMNTRKYLALAAVRIANDYSLGVGANNFSMYTGPFSNYAPEMHQGRKNLDEEDEEIRKSGGVVETIYLLVAAECGWIGLVSLILFFYFFWGLALVEVFRLRHHPCFGVATGIFGGLSANYLQSIFEWSLKQYGNFYQLMLMFALLGILWTFRKVLAGRKIS